MPARKKMLLATTAVAALAVPTAAIGSGVIEVGGNPNNLVASCPGTDCVALAKVTGYQAKVGTSSEPMVATKSGRIVAWTVTLGKPTAKQIKFFAEDNSLGEAAANFTVLRPTKRLKSTVVRQGPVTKLTKYFGKTVTFPLIQSISVRKGDVIALTSQSWAPVMAINQPSTSSWRASRGKGKCDDKSGKDYSQITLKKTVQYACLYRGVQLLYSVTVVPNPSSK